MVQAHEKKPIIQTEDLQPKSSIAGYRFTWQEHGLIAWAELEPIDDQPGRGFLLTWGYDTVSGREPGQRQIDQGTTLVSKVRDLIIGQMVLAGWVTVGALERKNIWQHRSRIKAAGHTSRVLSISAREKVKGYKRTITANPVTFTCSCCGHKVTREVFPGAKPQYCDDCALKVKREKTRARVARLRAAKRLSA